MTFKCLGYAPTPCLATPPALTRPLERNAFVWHCVPPRSPAGTLHLDCARHCAARRPFALILVYSLSMPSTTPTPARSSPVLIVPQTHPPRAPPSTSAERTSTRRSSLHRTRFLQVPVSRNCAPRHGSASPTSTSVSLSATHAVPSPGYNCSTRASPPSAQRNLMCILPPL
jgi:hypothetical protein